MDLNGYYDNSTERVTYDARYTETISFYDRHGIAVAADIGWKIDVGKEGGFFIETSFGTAFLIGKVKESRSYIFSLPDDFTLVPVHEDRFNLYKIQNPNTLKDINYFSIVPRVYLGTGFAF